MHYTIRNKYIFAIFDIHGDITFTDASIIEKDAMEQGHQGIDNIVFNFDAVPYIDSAALGILLKISRKLEELGIALYLMNVNDVIKGVLKISGTLGQFRYIRDEESLMKMQSRKELDDILGDGLE